MLPPNKNIAFSKYPFGSTMAERGKSFGGGYRFGFNTQEKEPELGDGVTSAEFWMYDGKLGRRWNVDPVDQMFISNYAVNNNNPISNIDIKGDYFFRLFGSTKEQREAARNTAKEKNGTVKNIHSKSVHVLWQQKYEDLRDVEGSVKVTTQGVVNRKTFYTEDGTAVTQRLISGQWEAVLYQSKPKVPLFRGNESSTRSIFVGDKNEIKLARDQANKGELDKEAYQAAYDKINELNNAIFFGIVSANIRPSYIFAPREVVAAKTGMTAYETALAGGKHSGFLKNYLGRSADEMNKAIRSMQTGKEGISVHLDKIANPTKYVPDWNTLRPEHQQSLIKGWQNTVTKHTEQIQILQTLLSK